MGIRDLLVAGIIFGSLPFILWRPQIGVMMWVWISVMNPHRLTWNVSYDFNFAAVVAVVTLVGALVSKDLKRPPVNALIVMLFLFIAWTGVTTVFALYPDDSYERWTALMKTQLMVFLIPMLFHKKEDLRLLMWVIVLSVAFYGIKGGLFILMTGGGDLVWGPRSSYIEDNNYLAVAIIMMIPLMRYLQLTTPHKYVRWGLTAMMLLCGVAVLGSYSRGALLAVTAMVAFLWWKGRHKLPVFLVAVAAIPLVLAYMPDRWYQRMDTISTYEQDRAVQMRFNSWGTMLNIAKARPIVGGGFEVAEKDVYAQFSPDPSFPPQVAHSIYFQAMGEHGFVGLGLFLLLYFAFWRHAGALVRLTRGRTGLAWAENFGLMIQVSLVGFAVGGAFLSLVNFDVPYYLIGVMVATMALVERELRAQAFPVMETDGTRMAQKPAAADVAGLKG
jgi:putative inorganic carbon (HCO3(-)) transporter